MLYSCTSQRNIIKKKTITLCSDIEAYKLFLNLIKILCINLARKTDINTDNYPNSHTLS